jgi:hypothetical protein
MTNSVIVWVGTRDRGRESLSRKLQREMDCGVYASAWECCGVVGWVGFIDSTTMVWQWWSVVPGISKSIVPTTWARLVVHNR